MLSGDPMLGELIGSPGFHPLEAGSPAIDAGDPRYCRGTDQVGASRPRGAGCDIGAVEFIPEPRELAGCRVTTTHVLNFRAGPAGARIGQVPQGATVTATARTPGWFSVEYGEVSGWISADYVLTEGDCG